MTDDGLLAEIHFTTK